MTVESAFKRGTFLSIPADIVSSIGRSTKHEGCGVVTMKGGTTYVCRQGLKELAKMLSEDDD